MPLLHSVRIRRFFSNVDPSGVPHTSLSWVRLFSGFWYSTACCWYPGRSSSIPIVSIAASSLGTSWRPSMASDSVAFIPSKPGLISASLGWWPVSFLASVFPRQASVAFIQASIAIMQAFIFLDWLSLWPSLWPSFLLDLLSSLLSRPAHVLERPTSLPEGPPSSPLGLHLFHDDYKTFEICHDNRLIGFQSDDAQFDKSDNPIQSNYPTLTPAAT